MHKKNRATNTNMSTIPLVARDESWMYFNYRILLEAQREDVPLLERLNFLGIYSNNLDEFFRVRVASLRRNAEHTNRRKEAEEAQQTLKVIYRLAEQYAVEFEATMQDILRKLGGEGIYIINETELSQEQKKEVLTFYLSKLAACTIPFFLNKMKLSSAQMDESLYLAIDLKKTENGEVVKREVALVRTPENVAGRFVRLPDKQGKIFLMFVDDVLRVCLPYIFLGMEYDRFEAYAFKFTKDAEMDVDGDLQDSMMQRVHSGIQSRKEGEMLRIVFDREMPTYIRKKLFSKANLSKKDVKLAGGRYHNTRDLMHFPKCDRPDLHFPPQPPLVGAGINFSGSMLSAIFKEDHGLYFPYHSFDRFLRLLREAAISPSVQEIKITLYRVAKHSKVVETLIAAARNGKKVTAVVELLARFDEESNLTWSRELEEAGVEVLFGPEKLKIHSKLVHVVTSMGNIACVGTGNMHEGTAAAYTDYMMMTHRRSIVSEVAQVFDFIEHPFKNIQFKRLLVSPNDMRSRILRLIDREIKNKQRGLEAFIHVKLNHITDERIIKKLYAASQANVPIKLLVRGNSSLVPEVPGISDNIMQKGIIDRYLEHPRILIFGNAGDPEYYIGSSDWMGRNLDRRIEVFAPVYEPKLKEELARIIDYGIRDTSQSHYVNYRGNRPVRETTPRPWFHAQRELYLRYKEEDDTLYREL